MLHFLPKPLFAVWDNNGLPLQGGKIYSYVAGTSIPKDLYHDAEGLVPWTNPIILDARGEALGGIYGSGVYKLKVYDQYDNLIWTMDNIRLDWDTEISNIHEWLEWFLLNMAGRLRLFPFVGRGDRRPIQILDEEGRQAYFVTTNCLCHAEGGTKVRYPYVDLFPSSRFPDYMLFDVTVNGDGYGTHIVPRHDFTFPYNSPCVFCWYAASFDVSDLPDLQEE